jgi:hypothetical protein
VTTRLFSARALLALRQQYIGEFIEANPNATAKEVYQFGGKLMDQFGLSNLPIVPYR